MTTEYSRRELAERLAASPEEVTPMSGRLQHWTERGLFKLLGEKHVGRGRSRRYPEQALWLAAFFDHCADRGATIVQMAIWSQPFMHIGRQTNAGKHLQDAIAGKPVFLLFQEPFERDPQGAGVRSSKFSETPEVPTDWLGASIFNLTAIFDRIRR